MKFIGMKLLEKDGEVKQFFNEAIEKAIKDGWKEYTPKKLEEAPEETPVAPDPAKQVNLDDLTYVELKQLAKEKGLKNANVKREELIKFLEG